MYSEVNRTSSGALYLLEPVMTRRFLDLPEPATTMSLGDLQQSCHPSSTIFPRRHDGKIVLPLPKKCE